VAAIEEVHIRALPLERFRPLLGERYREVAKAAEEGRRVFAGRANWHVNSTARGGGVVELLVSLLAYARGAGVDARWAVVEGNPRFFAITKRIHNHLHGWAGDRGALGDAERPTYEAALEASADELRGRLRPGDIVFLHDPQTAGLAPALRDRGVTIVWRCHVGLDLPNDLARAAWAFLRPYVEAADAYVFSRREFVWEGLDERRVWIVAPSIDVFSPKNQHLDAATVDAILAATGLSDGLPHGPPVFTHVDGSPGRVDARAETVQSGPIPHGTPVVAQVSRWDRLKDPAGVLACFAEYGRDSEHLVLAGPGAGAVADDPEAAAVLEEVRALAAALPDRKRERVHLACLPMEDREENAAIVNALQRRATVVVQKSLAEGFGLTVGEAMWKRRPVVASRRGGIQDQIVDGESGILLDDPTDLDAAGRAIRSLLDDPARAKRMGVAAQRRIEERFLGTRHLIQYLHLLRELIEAA